MHPEEFMFILFTFIFVMAVLRIVHEGLRRRMGMRERELELRHAALAAPQPAPSAQMMRIEERLRVLERIATDGNSALAAQIDQLRTLDAIEDKERAL